MKYKLGDKVKIHDLQWFSGIGREDTDGIDFVYSQSGFCDKAMTISFVGQNYYKMEEDYGQFFWDDHMIKGLASEHKSLADNKASILFGCYWREGHRETIGLPEGCEFQDEDGNVINVQKIIIFKKKTYPKTYQECCQVLLDKASLLNDKGYKADLIVEFQKLLVCRDAYWKIAGEEMGLGKPWDMKCGCGEWGYWIGYDVNENKIYCQDSRTLLNRLLVFPTKEMRDAFYENFKKEIEICKELL